MRKNILALSIAAMVGGLGMAGAAHAGSWDDAATNATALAINSDGVGHMLLVPYYTVQNGQSTLINLVNHDTVNAKAVKVRFRGAANSDDVFDFTLFLSPGDMWSANISQGADGKANLTTRDTSCTLPASVRTSEAGTSFVTARLDSKLDAAGKAAGTREGYVEIFNMANIPAGDSAIYKATKHVDGKAPCTSAAFSKLLAYSNIDSLEEVKTLGFAAPTTGLSGTWTIIDVPGANAFSGNATAIEARNAGAAANGRIVLFSQTAESVAKAAAATFTADPLLVEGKVAAAQYDFPDMSTPYLKAGDANSQAAALTGTLAVKSIENEFYTNPVISGATDWVFSMPTRRYSVAFDYAATTAATQRVLNPNSGGYFTEANTEVDGRQICVNGGSKSVGIGLKYWNREEGQPNPTLPEFVVSPGVPEEPSRLTLCGEAAVIVFNAAGGNSSLSAAVARKDVDLGAYNQGWAKLDTSSAGKGLPILGASFQKYVNPKAAPGVLGNYGVAYPHKVTR